MFLEEKIKTPYPSFFFTESISVMIQPRCGTLYSLSILGAKSNCDPSFMEERKKKIQSQKDHIKHVNLLFRLWCNPKMQNKKIIYQHSNHQDRPIFCEILNIETCSKYHQGVMITYQLHGKNTLRTNHQLKCESFIFFQRIKTNIGRFIPKWTFSHLEEKNKNFIL
jgi:hypothetical protein